MAWFLTRLKQVLRWSSRGSQSENVPAVADGQPATEAIVLEKIDLEDPRAIGGGNEMESKNADVDRVAGLLAECDRAEERIFYRSEAGVFGGQNSSVREAIASDLRQARESAESGTYAEASQLIMSAYGKLHDSIAARGFSWAAIHLHAVHIYGYYLALLGAFLWFGLTSDSDVRQFANRDIWSIPVSVAAYGMLGGLIRGLFWLPQKVETRSFRAQFTMVYLSGPWLAMLLGMLAYVSLAAGLLVLSDGTDLSEGVDLKKVSAQSLPPGFVAGAVFAGFSWEWITERVNARIR